MRPRLLVGLAHHDVQQVRWLGELRHVATVFVRLPTIDYTSDAWLDELNGSNRTSYAGAYQR